MGTLFLGGFWLDNENSAASRRSSSREAVEYVLLIGNDIEMPGSYLVE